MRRDPLGHEGHYGLGRQFGLRPSHHEGQWILHAVGVEGTDHSGIGDLGVLQQHRFEHRRRHLVAAVLDQLFDPVDDAVQPLGVDGGRVAGVQPAVLVDGRRGGLGLFR